MPRFNYNKLYRLIAFNWRDYSQNMHIWQMHIQFEIQNKDNLSKKE